MNAKHTAKLKKIFKYPTFNDVDIICELLSKGASPNLRNANKQSILTFGCWYGLSGLVEAALKAGANPNIDNGAPLLSAVQSTMEGGFYSSLKAVELLIEYGADVNKLYYTEDYYGNEANGNALMIAIQNSQKEKAILLINAGTNLKHKDRLKFTAYKWAEEMGLSSICKLILEKTGKKIKPGKLKHDPFIEETYSAYFTKNAKDHCSGIVNIIEVYSAKKFPGCNNPPIHLLTIDLSKIKEFPDKIKKIGHMPIVFHNCECDEYDEYNFKILKTGKLKPLDPVGNNDCAPEDFTNSKKVSGVKLSPNGKTKADGDIIVGGEPHWAQAGNPWPCCPECGKKSFFVVFIYQFHVPPGAGGRGNFLNIFVCPDCKTQSIVRQIT